MEEWFPRPKKPDATWAGVVDRFLGEGNTVFAYAINHYQNHSPSTLERFLELRR
jgi:hypothetical protein